MKEKYKGLLVTLKFEYTDEKVEYSGYLIDFNTSIRNGYYLNIIKLITLLMASSSLTTSSLLTSRETAGRGSRRKFLT